MNTLKKTALFSLLAFIFLYHKPLRQNIAWIHSILRLLLPGTILVSLTLPPISLMFQGNSLLTKITQRNPLCTSRCQSKPLIRMSKR